MLAIIVAAGLLFGPAGLRPEPQSAEAAFLSEVKKLLASDAQPFDQFGFRVAVSGDTAVVGAYGEDAGTGNEGAAYVFQRDQSGMNNWGEVKKLTASDAAAGDQFGWSVAVSGDTAVIGAQGEGAGGAAYVFQRDQGGANTWGEVTKLTASNAGADDLFGYSVAVSGDTAVVGAFGEDAFLGNEGAAYVFQRDQGGANTWGEVKKLTASDAFGGDRFGSSVAVSVDTAVVGAYHEDGGAGDLLPDAGAAYVFGRNQGGADNWGEVKKLTASDAQAGDLFGWSVAVSAGTAVVGAFYEDGGAGDPLSNAGAAYVFQRNQGGADNWGETKKLTASDAQADDSFGYSVAVSGDTAVVGAGWEDTGGDMAGAAYVFREPPPPKLAKPGDTDGDGCPDAHENRDKSQASQGGGRDWQDPNDYYDVYGPGQSLVRDGVIDLANDILGVIEHFAPLGTEAVYDVRFDRGQTLPGQNHWKRAAPDGVIDLANDILGVILQFQHNCV